MCICKLPGFTAGGSDEDGRDAFAWCRALPVLRTTFDCLPYPHTHTVSIHCPTSPRVSIRQSVGYLSRA